MRDLDVVIDLIVRLHLRGDSLAGLHLALAGVPLMETAVRLGWLQRTGLVTSLECPECEASHNVCVLRGEKDFALDCPRLRGRFFTEADLTSHSPSLSTLISSMQKGLETKSVRADDYVNGRLFRVGFIEAAGPPPGWTALFGFGLEEEGALLAALEAIRRRLPDGPGLLISADPLPHTLPLPKRYRLARPSEIWDLTADGLALRPDSIAPLLGGAKPKRKTGAGRENRMEDVRRAAAIVRRSHAWPETFEDQRRLLEAHWPKDLPPAPKRTAMMDKLAILQREESGAVRKSANPH